MESSRARLRRLHTGRMKLGRRFLRFLVISLVFLFAFLSVLFAVRYVFDPEFEFASWLDSFSADQNFPHAIEIRGGKDRIWVKNSPDFHPQAGKDMVFGLWVQLKRYPKPGELLIFVDKAEQRTPSKRGFRMGFLREENGIFPIVSWRDGSGQGQVFRFSRFQFQTGNWIFLALSFEQDKILGLRGFEMGVDTGLRALGGYPMDDVIYAVSGADFYLGSLRENAFRGRIGPFFLYNGTALSSLSSKKINWDNVLEQYVRRPLEKPADLPGEGMQLWAPQGHEDLSGRQRSMEVQVRGKRKDKDKSGDKNKDRDKDALLKSKKETAA